MSVYLDNNGTTPLKEEVKEVVQEKKKGVEEENWDLPEKITMPDQIDNWEERIATYDEER